MRDKEEENENLYEKSTQTELHTCNCKVEFTCDKEQLGSASKVFAWMGEPGVGGAAVDLWLHRGG